MKITDPIVVHLPDTRAVVVSPYGLGNLKIGPTVYTYSRLPGHPSRLALGSGYGAHGTCPGASPECEAVCYARRPVMERGAVFQMWSNNSLVDSVPPIPADCRLLRLHVGGDFDTVEYTRNWVARLEERPDVAAWIYTRSWRVPALLPELERLRALPNVQVFASMDGSIPEMPPAGWRRSWIDGDPRAFKDSIGDRRGWLRTADGTPTLVCPEQTGDKKDCEECGYCFVGKRNDVTFLRH